MGVTHYIEMPSTPAAAGGSSAPVQPDGAADDGFGFYDLLDIVNPLQHIPVVSTIYREITGDEIHPVSRIVGAGLMGLVTGGVAVGVASAVANVALEEATGEDVGGMIMDAVFGGDDTPESTGEASASRGGAAAQVATGHPQTSETPLISALNGGPPDPVSPVSAMISSAITGQATLDPSTQMLASSARLAAVDHLPERANSNTNAAGKSLDNVTRQVASGVSEDALDADTGLSEERGQGPRDRYHELA